MAGTTETESATLPDSVREAIEELGPWLALGLTCEQVGLRLSPQRSEDYVAHKVRLIRQALAATLERQSAA